MHLVNKNKNDDIYIILCISRKIQCIFHLRNKHETFSSFSFQKIHPEVQLQKLKFLQRILKKEKVLINVTRVRDKEKV